MVLASGGLFVESGQTTIRSPQPSRREAQKHHEVHRCCPHRARHDHDSRSYTPHAPTTRAPIYEPYRVSRAELREDLHRRKAFREQALKKSHVHTGTWHLPARLVPCTAVYVFCISSRHLLRPATRTGPFSALGWDRLPSPTAA